MKKLLLLTLLFLTLPSCSNTDYNETIPQGTCYPILTRGYDERGNFIIVKISNYNNRRYKVDDYQTYLGINEICEPINLTQETL